MAKSVQVYRDRSSGLLYRDTKDGNAEFFNVIKSSWESSPYTIAPSKSGYFYEKV